MVFDCGFERDNNWFRCRAAAIIIEEDCVLFARNELDNYFYSVGGGIHINECSEDAVRREVLEETGIPYEIDRLAVIHENFFDGKDGSLEGMHCHEISFYYLMKSRGSKLLCSNSYTMGVRENMYWIPIKDLGNYKAFPTFLQNYLQHPLEGIVHIVTKE